MKNNSDKNYFISKRLRKVEEILGIKPARMAKMGGCSQATYYRYRKGKSVPDSIFLKNIIKSEKNIRAEWLLTGEGPMLSMANNSVKPSLKSYGTHSLEFVNLAFYKMIPDDGDAEGKLLFEEWQKPSYTLPFSNIFLTEFLKVESDNLFAMRVGCDSMSPDIKPGSLVIVNEDKTKITADGIFVIRFEDVVRMKLVQPLPNDILHLTTINKKYDPVKINLNETRNFEILGQIIWVGTPLLETAQK